jgi:hypothetical protein
VTTRKEGTGAVSEGTEDHDLTLAEFALAPDNDEYVEADDLDESGSDSDESDDEYIHLSDIGSVEGSPATQLSRHVDSDEDGAVSQPQSGRGTVTTSSAAIPPPTDILLDSVAGLCAFICKEPFHDGKSATTIMVYFAGVLGARQDGVTFERPRNYTSKLSAIVHSARLCLLEATLPRFPHSNLNWGPRPSLGQDIILNQMREAFLCQGSSAPVSELLSLRAYGRVLARTDGSTFRVEWTDDGSSVKWEDGSLTMTQFRALGHHALRLAEGTIDALVGKYRLGLNLSLLRDRISEHRRGYSFVQEPKNNISSAYLDLANKICADPESGLMTRNGWNMRSVRQFLRKEEILLEQIMLMMYLRGGQAPRTTEFFSLRCWNGASTSRGLYIHEDSILYVTRHSKARRATNREFQVARYLPKGDSLTLATYLVYVRPLAEMIYRSSFGADRERSLLFSSLQEPEKLWRAGRLTSALKKLTLDVAGLEFGVRAYRQLSIAVTERHLAHISSPFNRYDDKGADAKIEVAFAWQSGQRPLQRGTSYGIDAAFPDSLQPALLRVYKWASEEWHRFLDRSSDEPDIPKALTLEPGKRNKRSQAFRKRIRAGSPTTGTKRPHQDKAENLSNTSEPLELFLLPSSVSCVSPPRWIHRTIDSYESNDIDNINCQSPKCPGNPSDARRVHEVPTENEHMEDSGKMPILQDVQRDTAVQCFHYDAAYRVLICKNHGYAVTSWKRHFSDYHAFSAADVKDAARFLQELDILKPEITPTPLPNGPSVDYLQPSRIGFECRGTSTDRCGRNPFLEPQ